MSGKKKNWKFLKNQKYGETVKGRDVYNDQQLRRGVLRERKTMFSRNVISLCLSALAAFCTFLLWSAGISIFGKHTSSVFISYGLFHAYSSMQVYVSLGIGFLVFAALQPFMRKNLEAQNMLCTTDDINQYTDDQHVALPEELQVKFNYFPDVGAHSSVQVSSLISHMALSNKGIRKVRMVKRYDKDVHDSNGEIAAYKGEIIYDDENNPKYKKVPMFDTKFADALFEASGAPREVRKTYNVRKISYNPGNKNKDKLCGEKAIKVRRAFTRRKRRTGRALYNTVSDLINKDWYIPEYEPQRPAGVYLVDSAPVNTMILAITRAGKGQTIIEPTIDMWMREKRLNNILLNDPKGELLVKNYVRGTVRGYQIVQFNLINAMKTDIYNPLGMAAQAAREGDFTKCAAYVESVAEVFFPLDGAEDPVWPNAANNAFKRAAYGLIDYYLEEERTYRNECSSRIAAGEVIDPQIIDTHVDTMWGKVTLYNCYQMFVQLVGKKMPNPAQVFANNLKSGQYDYLDDEEINSLAKEANQKSVLWNGSPELDCLSLYFNATDYLPKNTMRTLVGNINNSLKSMAGADKMMASVYGIAITAMSFFTDPTISTLTSGTPSQTVDLAGLSFPRRMGVRFHPDFVKKRHYIGLRCTWDAFEDIGFTKNLGKLFQHSDIVSREGWARYFFDGKFETDTAYIRLRLTNASTDALVHEYYFEFHKGYQISLDGRTYVKDPVLGTKIAKNGVLYELVKDDKTGGFKPGATVFKRKRLHTDYNGGIENVQYKVSDESVPAITQSYVRYCEKPKMIFLVTPPHLMKYAKLILILIKQLVDLNFDQSYMTKPDQKPLYKTRYMLDELGNLKSEGHGISGFETMLSIGLGQDQQFTLVLQTLQQLREVYGESVDKIVQGNTSNIIFLKSTDDEMLRTLSNMSGTTHRSYIDQKTVTRDMEKLLLANEGKASYMMQTKEVPVISYNDMMYIEKNNSMVFRAGDSPIWNRNETILPMSHKLFENTIKVPGREYSLQTIPTLSSAMDFDLMNNQPDFDRLLDKRIEQALIAESVMENYNRAFNYDDDDIRRLDKDIYADDIMDMIDAEFARQNTVMDTGSSDVMREFVSLYEVEENKEMQEQINSIQKQLEENEKKIYAEGYLSKADLINEAGKARHGFDNLFAAVFVRLKDEFARDGRFSVIDGSLYGGAGTEKPYIIKQSTEDMELLAGMVSSPDARVFADEGLTPEDIDMFGGYRVTDEFIRFIAGFAGWDTILDGKFDAAVAELLRKEDDSNAA